MILNTKEIDDRFNLSWEQLSQNEILGKRLNEAENAVTKLNRSLKWALAYANIRNYCGQIINPYSSYSGLVIKRFWVQYFEKYFREDQPPMPQDFFEWYCDNGTIKEEQLVLTNG